MIKSTLILFLAFVSISVFAQPNESNLYVVSQDVGKPLTYKYLQLFPVYANSSFQEANQHIGTYLSLQKALKTGQVSISEVEVPSSQQIYDPFSNSMIVSQELTSYEQDLSGINANKTHRIESNTTEDEDEDSFSIFDNRILHPEARANEALASTSKLYISNHSQDTIFLMAGEVLKGGRQDRVIAKDMIVPPSSEKVHLPVFCAEKDRWYYRSKSNKDFDQYFAVSSLKVRKAVAESNDQAAVWSAIEDIQLTNNIDSKTKAYSDLRASMGFNTEQEDYISYFTKNFDAKMRATKGQNNQNEKMVGVIVATGGTIIGCDIFATHDLFVQQYRSLLHSYTTDAITYGQELSTEVKPQVISINQQQLNQYLESTLKLSEKGNLASTAGEELEEEDNKSSLINTGFEQKVHISSFE